MITPLRKITRSGRVLLRLDKSLGKPRMKNGSMLEKWNNEGMYRIVESRRMALNLHECAQGSILQNAKDVVRCEHVEGDYGHQHHHESHQDPGAYVLFAQEPCR
jgi:hypothetical protein